MHIPVLLQTVLDTLNPKPGEFFVDGTLGAGGHAGAILKKLVPGGAFLGIDRDTSAIDAFKEKVEQENYSLKQLSLLTANYSQLKTILADRFESKAKYQTVPGKAEYQTVPGKADGILLDLGLSSDQLGTPIPTPTSLSSSVVRGKAQRAAASASESEGGAEVEAAASAIGHSATGEAQGRGFSFLVNDPLLMTYEEDAIPVHEHLKRLSEKDLADIIRDYSQERFASKIATSIKSLARQGKMQTTFDLVEAIRRVVPSNYEKGRIHSATRTFMALRIYANKEMEHLDEFLQSIPDLLSEKGRVGIISFHSLEDRRVKHAFKELERTGDFKVLTKKAMTASLQEMDENPRSRSAKYRVLMSNR